MNRTSSEQKTKMRNYKSQIKIEQSEIQNLLANLDVKKEFELPKEEQDANAKTFKDNLAIKKANITALKSQLNDARLNRLGSSFFEYTPHEGLNRIQARKFRKERIKNGRIN